MMETILEVVLIILLLSLIPCGIMALYYTIRIKEIDQDMKHVRKNIDLLDNQIFLINYIRYLKDNDGLTPEKYVELWGYYHKLEEKIDERESAYRKSLSKRRLKYYERKFE